MGRGEMAQIELIRELILPGSDEGCNVCRSATRRLTGHRQDRSTQEAWDARPHTADNWPSSLLRMAADDAVAGEPID